MPDAAKDDHVQVGGNTDPSVAVAIEDEQSMSLRQAFRRYPSAVFWSIALSLTIVMEGYDTSLMFSLFAFPPFVEKFGTYYPELGKKTIPGDWQVALGNAAACGSFIGLLVNGYVTEKFGHRKVTIVGLVLMSGIIFITFFAPNIKVLIAGQVLVGIPWGIFAIMGSAYSSEICPLALRGYLLAFVNICWVIGQLIAAGVLQGFISNTSTLGYRIPWAIQWVWPIPLILLAFFAPDSPWWLVRQGRESDAGKSMKRLSSGLSETEIKQKVAMMVHTTELEKSLCADATYLECFKGINLRRTEIASMTLCSQTLPGQAMCYSASYFFTQAGLDAGDAYKLNFGSLALAFFATILLLCAVLLSIGAAAFTMSRASMWAQSALAIVWLAVYSATIGPQTFTLAAEISATRLRSQTISIARNAYIIVGIIDNTIQPYLINPTEANLKGKAALVWFGIGVLTLLWAVFRLPETKGKTYEELDVLFEKKIPAWRFASTRLDVIAEAEILRNPGKQIAEVERVDH
ncbi:mfs alpha-glucoside transporter [Fusarium albosuccineum]|uniref:Mfs alpha-glucoside transporter n=1 Tax=Fusarium albosuccineum TaxID=1237068 RepID=A0A8H4L0J2_9HYPO|nr:mfs alpha-glucoside transporter [Fusarium albosuccineum]